MIFKNKTMKKLFLLFALSVIIASCKKKEDCTSITQAINQNENYTATQHTRVTANISGCTGVWIKVNGIKVTENYTQHGGSVSIDVYKNDVYRIESNCIVANCTTTTICE